MAFLAACFSIDMGRRLETRRYWYETGLGRGWAWHTREGFSRLTPNPSRPYHPFAFAFVGINARLAVREKTDYK